MTFQMREPRNLSEVEQIAKFMAVPELYWAANDRLAPQPEQINFMGYLCHPDTATFVARYGHQIIGFALFIRRTSIGAEMQVSFAKGFRGKTAKTMVEYAMAQIFKRGLLKLWSLVPSDNKLALVAARHIGMQEEGRLTGAVVREGGIRDVIIMAIGRDAFLARAR